MAPRDVGSKNADILMEGHRPGATESVHSSRQLCFMDPWPDGVSLHSFRDHYRKISEGASPQTADQFLQGPPSTFRLAASAAVADKNRIGTGLHNAVEIPAVQPDFRSPAGLPFWRRALAKSGPSRLSVVARSLCVNVVRIADC